MSEVQIAKTDLGPPAEVTTANQLLSVIAHAASSREVDVEKMERLLAMQERVMAQEAARKYSVAMQACQAEMPIVGKDAANAQTNSRYTRLETMYGIVVPIYTKHGFSVSYSTGEPPPERIRVIAKVSHVAGHTETHMIDVPSDHLGPKGTPNKTLVHAFGSSMSYARRYLTMLIFNIATSDDDDAAKKRAPESATELKNRLWTLLKPVRGDKSNWAMAQQWLIDECNMDPGTRVDALSVAELSTLIEFAKARLKETGKV